MRKEPRNGRTARSQVRPRIPGGENRAQMHSSCYYMTAQHASRGLRNGRWDLRRLRGQELRLSGLCRMPRGAAPQRDALPYRFSGRWMEAPWTARKERRRTVVGPHDRPLMRGRKVQETWIYVRGDSLHRG